MQRIKKNLLKNVKDGETQFVRITAIVTHINGNARNKMPLADYLKQNNITLNMSKVNIL